MELLIDILENEVYLFGLAAASIIGGIIKRENYFVPLYYWINTKLKNKKASLAVVSTISGIFPIEGRCTVSAPIMDSLCRTEHRRKLGVLDYIATHHYYLWSPLEPSVLIFMSVLGISWGTFMQATIIPLAVYLLFLVGVLWLYIDGDDVATPNQTESCDTFGAIITSIILLCGLGMMLTNPIAYPFYYTFPVIAVLLTLMSGTSFASSASFIQWKLIMSIGFIIGLGTYAKTHNGEFVLYLSNGEFDVPLLLAIGTIMAVILGSSSKYAGIGAVIVGMTNITLLPIVVVCEFAGYLVSPTHKCLSISNMYFGTKIAHMVGILGLLILLLVGAAVGTYYWQA